MRRESAQCLGFAALLFVLGACERCGTEAHPSARVRVLRLGHFPNVTHAHGLVAHANSRSGNGFFEQHLGEDVRIEWYVFNSGPSAMEALLAGSLDATYVGPSPVLNVFMRSRGEAVRILAGATAGGAALVTRKAAGIAGAADLRGRRIGTPQIGNTQDVACRAWLKSHGFHVTQTGGDVTVVPTAPADQLALFQAGELDAAWTVEPWVSRLELEGDGEILVEETDTVTTLLAASTRFIADHPEAVRRLVAAHRELTAWIGANEAEAKSLVCTELAAITRREVPVELVDRCWRRMRFTDAVLLESIEVFVARAVDIGFFKETPDLAGLIYSP